MDNNNLVSGHILDGHFINFLLRLQNLEWQNDHYTSEMFKTKIAAAVAASKTPKQTRQTLFPASHDIQLSIALCEWFCLFELVKCWAKRRETKTEEETKNESEEANYY